MILIKVILKSIICSQSHELIVNDKGLHNKKKWVRQKIQFQVLIYPSANNSEESTFCNS